MRTLLIASAAAVALSASLALPTSASAMPLAPGAALAINPGESLLDNVAYFCRPVWRCGPFACGWRQVCGWGPGPYAYGPRWGRPWAYRRW